MRIILMAALLVVTTASRAFADGAVERNVVYGMYSGLALLMDVYRPAGSANGLAIIAIQGSGWSAPTRYDAPPLKSSPEVARVSQALAEAGFTVFAINHRQAPRYRYPAQVEDAQRAVRFIRANATNYGIDPDHIGAWGSSSGGHIAQLLGTLDGAPLTDSDPVNRQRGKVQAVVTLFARSDLMSKPAGDAVTEFMGFAYRDPAAPPIGGSRADDPEVRAYRAASPILQITADDAPMLLLHGDQDEVVALEQSQRMAAALQNGGVAAQLITVTGGRHGANFRLTPGDSRLPDHVGLAARWFRTHLGAGKGRPN